MAVFSSAAKALDSIASKSGRAAKAATTIKAGRASSLSAKLLVGGAVAGGVKAAVGSKSTEAFDDIEDALLGARNVDQAIFGKDAGLGLLAGIPSSKMSFMTPTSIDNGYLSPELLGMTFGRRKHASDMAANIMATSARDGTVTYPYQGSPLPYSPRAVTTSNANAYGAQYGVTGDIVLGMYNLRMG